MEALQKLAVDTIKSHALRLARHSPRAEAYVLTEYLWAEEATEQAALYRGPEAEPPPWLAKLIAAQLADEQRHAGLIRTRLTELGVTPGDPPKLARAKIWWLERACAPYRNAFAAGPIVVVLAVAAQLEATGVRMFSRHVSVLDRFGDDATMLRSILGDERRHAKSCAAAARKLVKPEEAERYAELAAVVKKVDRSFGVTLAVRFWLKLFGLVVRDRIGDGRNYVNLRSPTGRNSSVGGTVATMSTCDRQLREDTLTAGCVRPSHSSESIGSRSQVDVVATVPFRRSV
ncbi:MAG: ferritin-like domain-containing protein [Kofleriaceae bacterium]